MQCAVHHGNISDLDVDDSVAIRPRRKYHVEYHGYIVDRCYFICCFFSTHFSPPTPSKISMIRLLSKQGTQGWKLLKKDPALYSATEISNVLGFGYISRKKFFGIRLGTDTEQEPWSQAIQRGRDFEKDGIDHFRSMGIVCDRFTTYDQVGSVLSFDLDLTCSPDALLLDEDNLGHFHGLEIKVPFLKPYDSDRPRPGHLAQVMASLLVTQAPVWWLHYYWPEDPSKSRTFKVVPDQESFDIIKEEVAVFKAQLSKKDKENGFKSVRQKEKEKKFETMMKACRLLK